MNEKDQELTELDLEDILKEFGDADDSVMDEAAAEVLKDLWEETEEVDEESADVPEEVADEELDEAADEEPEEEIPVPAEPEQVKPVTGDTIRLDNLAQVNTEHNVKETEVSDETVRLYPIAVEAAKEAAEPETEEVEEETAEEPVEAESGETEEIEEAEESEESGETEETEKTEEPEPKRSEPIVFDPRAKLRELKRKLVAGPERRYYELAEIGVGKLQMAMFLCLVVVAVSAGVGIMYNLEMIPENRMRLMVFGQVLAMLLGALMGCYQMLDGLASVLKGKFTANTLLCITFLACCADSVFCLQELRVPICAAFTLEVMMSLWAAYHQRTTEMGMMDTMRKSIRLRSVVKYENFYEGQNAVLRGEGEVEDFMDHYQEVSGPQKVQNVYALVALLASIAVAVAAGLLHGLSMGVQIFSTTLLVAMPASFFIALTRPMAVLERRLHDLGTVLCGWKGVVGLSEKYLYPLNDADLFPTGSVKMNGVKFYGDRNPETVLAYAAALMRVNGGGLAPIFEQLLTSRNGVRFTAENVQFYGNGGIGGEINGEPVLMGTLEFLKEMGVEIPDGTMVKQAVYVSVDGDLSGLFAITYNRVRQVAYGMATLCSSRRIRPVIIAQDFVLTAGFLKEMFGLRPRRTAFPNRADSLALGAKQADPAAPAMALTTQDSLASVAYAITGSRALRTASHLGVIVHMTGGILGILIMVALAVLGTTALLTPANILLYQLVWMIPGLVVTFWTRTI